MTYTELMASAESAGRTHAEAMIARVTDWTQEHSARMPGVIRPPRLGPNEVDAWAMAAEAVACAAWEAACVEHGLAPVTPHDGGIAEALAVEAGHKKAALRVARGMNRKPTTAPIRRPRWARSRA